jgi:ABC-type polar amino acid transport system ATPase subunit
VLQNITLAPRQVLKLSSREAEERADALPELVAEVLNIVRELAHEGMTMLLATHEMSFAREVSSRVCFLDGA